MKYILAIFCIGLFSNHSFSQSGSINGKLRDSLSGKGLPLATVTIFKANDTSIITYRLSNPDGDFKVSGLPLDIPLRMLVTYSGYKPLRREFKLSVTNNIFNFDTVKMASAATELDEVIVIAERPPVSIKHDTIEFNATAFKTLPNALVEDLLKKLPGVQVDADGNISVNGKVVNRILVDGKTFFGDDPKMATRNLPADIIDKVQVTDDKEQMLRNGDDNMANVGKVVNLSLKKGVKKGWFGKVYAGNGTDKRFEAGGIANVFRDTLQVSLLGYANNLNKPGFSLTDLTQSGGFERSNSNLTSRTNGIHANNSGVGLILNGISFGGLQTSGGVTTSKGAGFNLNHAPNTKQSLFAQYFYGNVLVERQNESDTKQFNGDSIIENHNRLQGNIITNAHNMGIGGKFKPDSVTTLQVSASYTLSLGHENRFSDISSSHNILGPLSFGNIVQHNPSNIYYYKHGLTYTRLSKTKKGRRFTVFHNLDVNNRFNYYTTTAKTSYLYPTRFDSLLNQLRQEGVPRTDAITAFNYSEPFGKKTTLRVGGRYEYGKLDDAITTFNPDRPGGKYDIVNAGLSSNFHRESNRFFISTGLEFKIKNIVVTPSARALFQGVDNVLASLNSPIRQTANNLLPGVSVVIKQFNFSYNKDITLPNYVYLIPVADNSNPYFISKGNANLLPAERHNFSMSYFINDPKRSLTANLNANASYINNDVVNSIVVDQKGIQTSTPVNVNDNRTASFGYSINRQYKNNPKLIYSWVVGGSYNYTRSRMFYNGEQSWQSFSDLEQFGIINLNFNDKFECNTSGNIEFDNTNYTNPVFKRLNVTSYYIGNEMVLRYPKHVIWESHFNYSVNGNTQAGVPSGMAWLNAAVNFTMLKDEKGVLRLSVTNAFDNGNNINAFVNRNVIGTSQTNVLGRYIMATFTYNIRTIGGKKQKVGGEKLFMF